MEYRITSLDKRVEWRIDNETGEFEMIVPGGSVYCHAIDSERLYILLHTCAAAIRQQAADLKKRAGLPNVLAQPTPHETRGAPKAEATDHDHAPHVYSSLVSRR